MATRTITTTATVSREAEPELATVEATVIGKGDEAAIARAQARDRAATIQESITAVSTDRIRTVDMQVRDSEEPFGPATNAAYRAKECLHIDCVPGTAEAVVVQVTDAGGTVQGVQFNLHEHARRQLQDDALMAATQRAREKADRIAAVEGLAVSEVQRVTIEEASTGMDSIVEEALNRNPDADFMPGPIAVSQAVEVEYELAEE